MAGKILLGGRPGVGKTTVVRNVIAAGIPIAGGFLTEEIRRSGQRLGFSVEDVFSGRRGVLAHVERKGSPRVGKYGLDVAAFDAVGVRALRESFGRDGCVIIDEIGKMELCSEAFRGEVTTALDSGHPVLATIPAYRNVFLDGLRRRADVTVIEVTCGNRDELAPRLLKMLGFSEAGEP
ncbi:MAG: NTPase [Planctomycetota bacterium]|jgi:nucleoside-triphosphatase